MGRRLLAPPPTYAHISPLFNLCACGSSTADDVSQMVEKLNEAHDEALGEIEGRVHHFAALYGNEGDDEILSSDL